MVKKTSNVQRKVPTASPVVGTFLWILKVSRNVSRGYFSSTRPLYLISNKFHHKLTFCGVSGFSFALFSCLLMSQLDGLAKIMIPSVSWFPLAKTLGSGAKAMTTLITNPHREESSDKPEMDSPSHDMADLDIAGLEIAMQESGLVEKINGLFRSQNGRIENAPNHANLAKCAYLPMFFVS